MTEKSQSLGDTLAKIIYKSTFFCYLWPLGSAGTTPAASQDGGEMFALLFALFSLIGCLHKAPQPAATLPPPAPTVEQLLTARCIKIQRYKEDFGTSHDRLLQGMALMDNFEGTLQELGKYEHRVLLWRNEVHMRLEHDASNVVEAREELWNAEQVLYQSEKERLEAFDAATEKLLKWRALDALRAFVVDSIVRVEKQLNDMGAGDQFVPFDPNDPQPCP